MTTTTAVEDEKSTTTQFTVSAAPLRTALLTALAFAEQPDDDYPPILDAVRFEPDGDRVVISATDRYAASRETLKAEGELFAVAVPAEIAEAVAGLIPDQADDPYATSGMVTFVQDGKDVTVRVVDSARTASVSFRPDRPQFPNLAKVFGSAEKATEEPAAGIHFHPERLARAVAAMRDRSKELIEVAAGGPDKPILLRQGADFAAIVMSVKTRHS